jgi:polyisoprenoid-binding protein YceI
VASPTGDAGPLPFSITEFVMMRFAAATATLVLLTGALVGAEFTLTGKNTTITFIGTKPNGRHEGGFKTVTGTATVPGKDLTELKITLDIDVDSMYTDTPKLTAHLKSPDFFGVKSNPKAKFVSTKVEKDGAQYKITGDLTMCGKTSAVTFPAQIAMTGGMLTLSSKFAIDRTQWGMTYGRGKVDDNVTLTVSVKAK